MDNVVEVTCAIRLSCQASLTVVRVVAMIMSETPHVIALGLIDVIVSSPNPHV